MIKLLYKLMSSRDPIKPTEEERLECEALFEKGLASYVYSPKFGDGYVISAKGREMISPHRQGDRV